MNDLPVELTPDATLVFESLARVHALRLAARGEVAASRQVLGELLALAEERGERWSYFVLRCQLCELELRVGDCAGAARLLEDWEVYSDDDVIPQQIRARYEALLAGLRGQPEEAEQWASRAIACSEQTGVRWDFLEALRASGIAALSASEAARAVERLRAVWEHTVREGIDDPGVFPVAPDLVTALVNLGELDEARGVAGRLRDEAERQKHPWALASADRCEAVIRLAETQDDVALRKLAEAVEAYAKLGLRFDRARSLLILGSSHRRFKKWRSAREALSDAVAAFDELGCSGWAEHARSELGRVAARPPRAGGGLTPAEQRVVALAVEGRSNKEIAAALFVTVHTVERHLSHAYAKLGVRSRAQLAQTLWVSGI
jgi:DNA-binding CsgD family transcriptional regulator